MPSKIQPRRIKGKPHWPCAACKRWLPRDAFSWSGPYRRSYCIPCYSARAIEYKKHSQEKARMERVKRNPSLEERYLAALEDLHDFADAQRLCFRQVMIGAIRAYIGLAKFKRQLKKEAA